MTKKKHLKVNVKFKKEQALSFIHMSAVTAAPTFVHSRGLNFWYRLKMMIFTGENTCVGGLTGS